MTKAAFCAEMLSDDNKVLIRDAESDFKTAALKTPQTRTNTHTDTLSLSLLSHNQTQTPSRHSETLAASKLTASFLCFLLEAEPGVWPVAGTFCRGGVCGAAVVMRTASARLGLDAEGLLLAACWCSSSILQLGGSL